VGLNDLEDVLYCCGHEDSLPSVQFFSCPVTLSYAGRACQIFPSKQATQTGGSSSGRGGMLDSAAKMGTQAKSPTTGSEVT
jgi:hypothetical protein